MTGTALVATETYCDKSGKTYTFPVHDVIIMGRIYLLWSKQAKNRIYPIRAKMAQQNWALFRSWFEQFRNATNQEIAWVSNDSVESVIFHDARKRTENPEWKERQSAGLKSLMDFLAHEPMPVDL